MPQPLSRRAVLVAATAAGLATATASCSRLTGSGSPAVPPAAPDPLEPLLTAELALVAGYDGLIARFPSAEFKAIRAEHHEHAQALLARLDPRRREAVRSAPAAPPVEAPTAAAAAQQMAAAERAAAEATAAACLTATGDVCALLASISASEASHAAGLA